MGRFFNPSRYPVWGVPVLAILGWHGWYTVATEGMANLLFVCYTATLLLGVGILTRNRLAACIGAGWLLVGFPLWLYDAIANDDWATSCIVFHVSGLVVGLMVLKAGPVPKRTGIFAMSLAMLLWTLARMLTPAALNVNAAFSVYRGWEDVFPNYWLFFLFSIAFFYLHFTALAHLSRVLGGHRSRGSPNRLTKES
jgi:hypothetical protein